MASSIQITTFKPSDTTRGVVTAHMAIKGKDRRVLHAILFVGAPPEITPDRLPKLTVAELADIAALMQRFHAVVQQHHEHAVANLNETILL
jgi:hypothetical protein